MGDILEVVGVLVGVLSLVVAVLQYRQGRGSGATERAARPHTDPAPPDTPSVPQAPRRRRKPVLLLFAALSFAGFALATIEISARDDAAWVPISFLVGTVLFLVAFGFSRRRA